MNGKKETDAAVDEAPVVTDVFDGVAFHSHIMRGMQIAIAPYLQHREGCDAIVLGNDGCSCGLRKAVQDLQQREIVMIRYGTVE